VDVGPVRQLRVSVSALAANIAREGRRGPVLVDVTADAFGLGRERVARAAREAGARGLYAAHVDDALALGQHAAGFEVYVGSVGPDRRAEAEAAGVLPVEAADAPVVRDSVYGFDGRAEATVSLRTEVISTKLITAGDGVSYGYTYRAERDERTALVALGYGDGVHRHAGNRASVLVDGCPAPVVGRVAMNVFVVSLGDRSVEPGAPVVVFGDPEQGETDLVEWSRVLGVAPAAVVAAIGDRVARVES
jgi:alanine racemase